MGLAAVAVAGLAAVLVWGPGEDEGSGEEPPASEAPEPSKDPPEGEEEPEPAPAPGRPDEGGAGGPDATCVAQAGALGFVRAPGLFLYRKGSTWRLTRSKEVLADRPRPENDWSTQHPVRCTLPLGSKVVLLEDPVRIRGAGNWIAVDGQAFELP